MRDNEPNTPPDWAMVKAKEYWYAIARARDPVGDLAQLLARDFSPPTEHANVE